MPTQLVTITSGLRWRRTVIRQRSYGLETELYLEVAGQPFSLAFDSLPENEFLRRVAMIQRLDIIEESVEELGGENARRYRVQIVGGSPPEPATAHGRYLRWGPVEQA